MVAVVKGNGNIGKSQRFSRLRTGEDNILHIAPSELFGALLAKNPADRIAYVAFSASVRSYDSGNSVMKFEIDFLCKGLKPLHFNVF